ncbi:MAG: phosphate acetyl/butaryl transferase, partial [Giesbergeria sp.]|nr:phosphate acetyl/butaryl transferase [Giesbergeria sp.]
GSGLVLGARVPIALTSRADGPTARVSSALLAVLAAYDARRERALKLAAPIKD